MSKVSTENQAIVLDTSDLSDWWWSRWLLFNGLLGFIGIGSVVAMEFLMSAVITEGEDAIEPFALFLGIIFFAIAANWFYFSAMRREYKARKLDPACARYRGIDAYRKIMRAGSLLTSIPLWYGLLFWVTNRNEHLRGK